jgi:hypothetical protein
MRRAAENLRQKNLSGVNAMSYAMLDANDCSLFAKNKVTGRDEKEDLVQLSRTFYGSEISVLGRDKISAERSFSRTLP